MVKQSDAIIILIVLAAVIGVVMLSSNTGSLVVIAVLATVFGGLLGTRLRKNRSEHADSEAGQAGDAAATDTKKATAAASASAGSAGETVPVKAYEVAEHQAGDGAAATVAKRRAGGEATSPAQVALLKNLVSSISEGITFKDAQGRYISANAAFAQMLNSRPSEIVGRDDAGVFGNLTARSLLASDDAATETGKATATLEVPLPNGPRYFEITKASVSNEEDSLEGIVAVWRDVTEPELNRQRREMAMRETINAFTKSIELRDSHLSDHAQQLAHLSAAVADAMEVDDEVATTVELAAYLSQIGKLGVDPQLLSQERRFTQQEIKEMQKHVHHAARLLRDLDFGLPVASTLFQMNERLDGTGYPLGLHDADIALPARILGACDVFCARIAQRSYRAPITPEAALDILMQNPHRYDETVVRAMQTVIASPAGAELLAQN